MITKIEEKEGKYLATLVGEMDTAAASEAEEVLKPLYQSDGKDVIATQIAAAIGRLRLFIPVWTLLAVFIISSPRGHHPDRERRRLGGALTTGGSPVDYRTMMHVPPPHEVHFHFT